MLNVGHISKIMPAYAYITSSKGFSLKVLQYEVFEVMTTVVFVLGYWERFEIIMKFISHCLIILI